MLNFDITGNNPEYKTSDQRYMVYQNNQVIEFNQPVFAGSIVINIVTSSGLTSLVPTVDWIIRDSDKDTNAVSHAKLVNPNFDFSLVKSLMVIKPYVEDYQITCSFQRYQSEYTQLGTAYGEGPPCTPGLLQEIITTLNYLKYVKDPSIDLVSFSVFPIRALDEDYTGSALTHIITDELHEVNVPNGRQIIRPGCGSFYNYDIEVKVKASGQLLTKSHDYIVVGANLPKTKVCYHPSGVYEYIYLIAPIVGEIEISYRAFGGEITVPDIKSIYASLVNLTEYLQSKEFLTDESLGYTTVVLQILERIFKLEEFARHATVNGTHGLSSAFYLYPTNSDKHWYNVASLYRTEMGGQNIHLKDKAILRVKFSTLPLVFDVAIGIDISVADPVYTVDVIGGSTSENYYEFKNYITLLQRAVPEFRVIWNEQPNGSKTSGIILQLGISLKGLSTDTVLITDISSPSSSWTLDVFPGPVAVIRDNNVLLPDGTSSWVKELPYSKSRYEVVVSKFGYLGWAGNINMAEPYKQSAVWDDVDEPTGSIEGGMEVYNKWVELFNRQQDTPLYMDMHHLIDSRDIYINLIKSVTVHIYDRFMNKVHASNFKAHPIDNLVYAGGFFDADDLCEIKVYIFTEGSRIYLGVVPSLGDSSRIHERFDIRQILLHF